MMTWSRIGAWLEIAGGARPLPDAWIRARWVPLALGVWWLLLFALAGAFAGRATKFVYVDF
jgi:hypothetical protein